MAAADPGLVRSSGGVRSRDGVAALGEVRLRSVPAGGRSWPALSWQAPSGPDSASNTPASNTPASNARTAPGWRGVSSSLTGGGLGPVDAWINVMVDKDYAEPDPVGHVHDLAAQLGMRGRVAGMITAADVRAVQQAEDGGVHVAATVGLGVPTLAAAPDGGLDGAVDAGFVGAGFVDAGVVDAGVRGATAADGVGGATAADGVGGATAADGAADGGAAADVLPVGTINILVRVPVPMSDAALVNLVMTVTEAKAQALAEAGFEATGTASDAVCVVCPAASRPAHQAGDGAPAGGEPSGVGSSGVGLSGAEPSGVELFGGPRSRWGARTARAVHRAVLTGAIEWRTAQAARSH